MTICEKETVSSIIHFVALHLSSESSHFFEISNSLDLVVLVCSVLKKGCASLVCDSAAADYQVRRNFSNDCSEEWQGKEVLWIGRGIGGADGRVDWQGGLAECSARGRFSVPRAERIIGER